MVETYHLNTLGGFSRCIECNISLTDVPREQVQEKAPSFVFQTQKEFMECSSCQKLYWRGTHWHNMLKQLAMIGEVQR